MEVVVPCRDVCGEDILRIEVLDPQFLPATRREANVIWVQRRKEQIPLSISPAPDWICSHAPSPLFREILDEPESPQRELAIEWFKKRYTDFPFFPLAVSPNKHIAHLHKSQFKKSY